MQNVAYLYALSPATKNLLFVASSDHSQNIPYANYDTNDFQQ